MKPVTQDISEMTYTKEFLDTKPFPFIKIFIYLEIGILAMSLIWANYSEIDIVVKANGVIRPTERISTINNNVPGKIKDIFVENGQIVNKGDILYVIDYQNLELNEEALLEALKKASIELDNLKKFKIGLLDEKNYFDSNSELESDYYYKYIKYEMDLDKITNEYNIKNTEVETLRKKILDLETLLSSILNNENYFDYESNEYAIRYKKLSLQLKELEAIVRHKKEIYIINQNLIEVGAISQNEMNNSKNDYEDSLLKLEKFKTETLLDIKVNLNNSRNILKELEMLNKDDMATGGNKEKQSTLEDFKVANIISINEKINIIEEEIDAINKNIENIRLQIDSRIIKSEIEGYLNVITDVNIGDNIAVGTNLATIVPVDNSQYKVEIYLPNKDIASIKLGDKIKYHFPSLPYKEYGELDGIITKISIDSRMTLGGQSSFYLVEATVKNDPLYSYKGERVEIKVGMSCEAHIITGAKKVSLYLLEKIDIWK